jgi:hypothetical protein
MTDVAAIVAQLNADKVLLSQVLAASAGGFDLPALTAIEIESLLAGEFNNQVYPVYLPEDASHPSLVYKLIGVDSFETDGYRLTQTDSYTLTIRTAGGTSSDYSEFETKMRAVIASLRTSAHSVEPVDIRLAYDDSMRVVVGMIDVEITYLAQPAGTTPGNDASELPVAFIYPAGRSADQAEYANLVKQRVTDSYAVVILTIDGNLTPILDEVAGSLLGFQQSAEFFSMEYSSGRNLGGISNMEVWREVYTDSHMITES